MAQTISRPALWASAVVRGANAMWDLHMLREEWLDKFQDFEAKWTSAYGRLNVALDQLIDLQDDYASWNVPSNLSQSRIQEKLDEVSSIDFRELKQKVPNLKAFFESVERFESDDAWIAVQEAKSIDPPKGYGRD
jgi:hypothetical protein